MIANGILLTAHIQISREYTPLCDVSKAEYIGQASLWERSNIEMFFSLFFRFHLHAPRATE
jgi:hypothetical protein